MYVKNPFQGSRFPGVRESRSYSIPEFPGIDLPHFPAKMETVQLMALLSFTIIAVCSAYT